MNSDPLYDEDDDDLTEGELAILRASEALSETWFDNQP